MRRQGETWEPAEPGRGLLDVHTLEPVISPVLISDEKIVMTDWELQDPVVKVVRDQLTKEDRDLISWNGDHRANDLSGFLEPISSRNSGSGC